MFEISYQMQPEVIHIMTTHTTSVTDPEFAREFDETGRYIDRIGEKIASDIARFSSEWDSRDNVEFDSTQFDSRVREFHDEFESLSREIDRRRTEISREVA